MVRVSRCMPLMVVAAGLTLGAAGCGAPPPVTAALHTQSTFDPFQQDPDTAGMYRWIVANQDVAKYLPCTCGCARKGHTSLLSCYVKSFGPGDRITYDPMGAHCGTCSAIAEDARRLTAEGKSVREIRQYVDANYQGLATPTPYPPQ